MNFSVLGVDLGTRKIGLCEMSLNGFTAVSLNLEVSKGHKARRKMVWEALEYFNPSYVVFESVRLFHQNFINIDSIKRLGGLTYMIIDYYDCSAYDIDVRSWKKLILGSAKATKDDSIIYVKKYGVETLDDNLADAICIAETGLLHKNRLREIE